MSFAVGPVAFSGTSRSTSATIQPNVLHHLASVAEERGVDLLPVLEQVVLDETVMCSAALRVSYRQGSTVIRRALELTGDARLGMKVGAVQNPTAWGLLGFALMASDTLQHAIETGVRYQNLSGAMVMWSAEQEDEGLVLRADLPDPGLEPGVAVFLIEEGLTSVVALSRLTAGPAFTPALAEFAFPNRRNANRTVPSSAVRSASAPLPAALSSILSGPGPGCRPGIR
nr:AraC family transcriptional regulator ligand-binding domain-containing protein [Streptomyces europaeiscabiei]